LLHGDIWLDEAYDGGVEGSPGARFVIRLFTPALSSDAILQSQSRRFFESGGSFTIGENDTITTKVVELPENLYPLCHDDDLVLRKLFRVVAKRRRRGRSKLRTGAVLENRWTWNI
jgi:hypothetical protein